MPRGQLNQVVRQLRQMAGLYAARGVTDATLLERYVASRDEAAFATLVARYGGLVRSVCHQVLRHDHDVDDAFQVTFLVFAAKAGSIQKATSVASWLYGVAYRTAMNAKRSRARRREVHGEAKGESREQPVTEAALRELQAILADELSALPEKYRAPFVLCCLEGKSKTEAARELGWKENTVSSRLARARHELRERLGRRGVALSAALCAVGLGRSAATAAVRPALVKCTIQAALSFAAGKAVAADLMSAEVADLAKGVLRSMWTTKLKIATAVLIAATCLTGMGVGASKRITGNPPEGQHASPLQKPEQGADAARNAAGPRPAEDQAQAVEISGRVLDPEGKPLAGAKLSVWTDDSVGKPPARERAPTGEDGRFRLQVTKAEIARKAKVVATAEGLGPDWIGIRNPEKVSDVTLRLAKDDIPITGRVLDLEGRPIAGVTVEVIALVKRMEEGDLTPWFEMWQARGQGKPGKQVPMIGIPPAAVGLPSSATTGRDGSFRLTGFGRERVVDLHAHGPTIEDGRAAHAMAATRTGAVDGLPPDIRTAKFDFLVGPCKPILGTVRDKRTGEPLAAIDVAFGFGFGGRAQRTDAKGRYRLEGVPKQQQYWIVAGGAPYFHATKADIADTPGYEPITVDFELERGLAVRGRLTDKTTGNPLRGTIIYLAQADNPNIKDYSQLGKATPTGGVRTEPDGSFAVAAAPGPGLLCAWSEEGDRYAEADIEDWEGFTRRTVPQNHPYRLHAVVPVNPSEKDPKSTHYAIALVPGTTRTGNVTGPDDKPLAGALAAGLANFPQHGAIFTPGAPLKGTPLKTASFTVSGLNPRVRRTVVFLHPEKRLGKLQAVPGDEAGALTVRLEPLGAMTGRIVDPDGRPVGDLPVRIILSGQASTDKDLREIAVSDLRPALEVTGKTDRDGKFRADGLIPGLPYDMITGEPGERPAFVPGIRVESGKVKDLGDVKRLPAAKEGKE
jgi:RNA polymerase sigma factor (sigma-70 family)